MTKIRYRLFFLWDFDEEERWLNEMAQKGHVLSHVSMLRYTFEDARPGEYQIRLNLLDKHPTHPESQEYIEFLAGTGVEYISHVMRWVYLRKKSSAGEFTLHSDYPSRIRQLRHILVTIAFVLAVYILNIVGSFQDYLEEGDTGEIVLTVLFGALSLLLLRGGIKIFRKKRQLEKEHELFE